MRWLWWLLCLFRICLPDFRVACFLEPGVDLSGDWLRLFDVRKAKWRRRNTRYVKTGVGRFRPCFQYPPPFHSVSWGRRFCGWLIGLCAQSFLFLSSSIFASFRTGPLQPFWRAAILLLCAFVVSLLRLRSVLTRLLVAMLGRLRSRPCLRTIFYVILLGVFLLCTYWYVDCIWLLPILPSREAVRLQPILFTTRVAGVQVLAHDVASARAVAPNHLNADWLLEDCSVSEFDFEVGDPESPEVVRARLRVVLQQKLADARAAGISSTGFARLSQIVTANVDAFGDKLENCSLSSLTPMDVTLRPGATPCIARPRTLGSAAEKFLAGKLATLQRIGVISKVTDSNWSSAVFCVPKKDTFRMVIDLRPLNSRVLPTALPMPLLEHCLRSVTKAKCFGQFDVLSGFDLMPCSVEASELFVISTFMGLYKLHCTPQGFVNSAQTFHNRFVTEVLGSLWLNNAVQWIDDSLLFGVTESAYLDALEIFLTNVRLKGLKLSLPKTILYTLEAEFCGRILRVTDSRVTVKFADRFYDAILQMGKPLTGTDLAQVLYASNWLAPTIPRLTEHLAPFRAMLTAIQTQRGSSKNKALVGSKLVDFGWNADMDRVWDRYRLAIRNAVALQTYDPERALCLFTDASDTHFAVVVTQCSEDELKLPHKEQKHAPLFFLSGAFKDAQLRWHVSSKESYPILFSFDRMSWLFHGHPREVHVFCDHQNLVTIMDPGGNQVVNKNTLSRLYRWALRLSEVRYRVSHIPGTFNVVADMLTRWGARVDPIVLVRLATMSVSAPSDPMDDDYVEFLHDRVRPLYNPDFKWPTLPQLLVAQRRALRRKPSLLKHVTFDDKAQIWRQRDGSRIWLPPSATCLRTRVVVIAHTLSGHGSAEVTLSKIHTIYYAPGIMGLIKRFIPLCLHCESGPYLIRRPLGSLTHATQRCELLHIDYLAMFNGYLLVIKDDLTSKVDLFSSAGPDAATVVSALILWRARYHLPNDAILMSDQGSHFCNQLVETLRKEMKFTQRYSVAYSPWCNGSAEVANVAVLNLFRALLSEAQLPVAQWPRLLPQVTMYLNEMPRRSLMLDGVARSPNSIFMGLKDEPDDLLPFIWEKKQSSGWRCSKLDSPALKELFLTVAERIDSMSAPISNLREHIRQRERLRHNKLAGVLDISFAVGDLILYSVSNLKHRSKLQLRWLGPCVVERIVSPHVYVVRDMMGKSFECHITRMKLYDSRSAVLECEEIKEQYLYNAQQFEVDKLVALKIENGEYSVQVAWKGLESNSWEPLHNLFIDVPELVLEFLTSNDHEDYSRALQLLKHKKHSPTEKEGNVGHD